MNQVLFFSQTYGLQILGYCFVTLLVSIPFVDLLAYFRIKAFRLVIDDDFIQTKNLFGLKKIFYKDINFVKFSNYVDSNDTPNFNIYLDISTARKERLSFFTSSLKSGDFERFFVGVVNNSEIYKNDADFIKFSKGEYTSEDIYRLAGVLNSYNFMYNVDLLDTKGSFFLNFLKYFIIAGSIFFVVLLVLMVLYI